MPCQRPVRQMSNDDQARTATRWHDRGMTATTDAFIRFLDVLTDTLDDHAASARSLAERAHLSRFHFDRLVSAAAGEPPAAMRRRILLERSAYRLITTDHD